MYDPADCPPLELDPLIRHRVIGVGSENEPDNNNGGGSAWCNVTFRTVQSSGPYVGFEF